MASNGNFNLLNLPQTASGILIVIYAQPMVFFQQLHSMEHSIKPVHLRVSWDLKILQLTRIQRKHQIVNLEK